MSGEPRIEHRLVQAYMGIRAVMPMSEFARRIPAEQARVSEWLRSHQLPPAGKPFLRYHVIDMPDRMDVELGIPVDVAPNGQADVHNDVLPAGRYAILTYKGVKNGLRANRDLIEWIATHGEQMVSHDSPEGEVFEARLETFLIDAVADTDQDEWEIEVAIKLRG